MIRSQRSEVLFVTASPGAEVFFPKRSVATRPVRSIRLFTSETYAANPNTLVALTDKTSAMRVLVNLRGDGGKDFLNNLPAVSLLTTGFKHGKVFDNLLINSDYCSIVVVSGAAVNLAFQFEFGK